MPCLGQLAAVGGAQFGVAGLQVHQVIKPLDQRTHAAFAADPFEGDDGGGGLIAVATGCGSVRIHIKTGSSAYPSSAGSY
ncbi:hypothetical protein D3C87_1921090 [compost metagenome]